MRIARRDGAPQTPKAFVFPPSSSFDGVDGSWSTFIVNIGDNGNGTTGQNFKVHISTSGSVTYVPIAADWCTVPNSNECADHSRGIMPFQSKQSLGFDKGQSSAWKDNGLFPLNLNPGLAFRVDDTNGVYGYDNVGLGTASKSSNIFQNQVVAGTLSKDYPFGLLGLSNIAVNFGGPSLQPLMQNARTDNFIPSASYGYTAGASYKNGGKGVTANLVLGGYDASRFSGGQAISMPGGENTTLVVAVQSVTVDLTNPTNTRSATAHGGFSAIIDSTLPYLFLPDVVCDQMKEIFNLTYDNSTGLYTISDDAEKANVQRKPIISLKVANSLSASDFVSIQLPYEAFDLQAKFPLYKNSTRYFPIRRSPQGNFVLGRAFLQEAYLIVDYERRTFNVSQAVFNDPMPAENIKTILPPSDHTDNNNNNPGQGSKTPSSSHPLSAGAIAGIAIAGVVILIIIAVLVYFFRRQKHNKRPAIHVHNWPTDQPVQGAGEPPPYNPDPTKHRRISELDTPTPGDVSSRTSTQGYFGNELESPDLSNLEMRMKQDGTYFGDPVTRLRASSEPQSPGSLNLTGPFELPADHGTSEVCTEPTTPVRQTPSAAAAGLALTTATATVAQQQRPPMKRRKRSNGGSSGGNHSMQGETAPIEAIAEDPNEGNSPRERRTEQPLPLSATSRFQEQLDDGDSAHEPPRQRHEIWDKKVDPGTAHEERQHHDRPPFTQTRMSVDEAAGLEGGEPGPVVLQDEIEPAQRTPSPSSSTTIAEPAPKDETQP